MDVWDELQVLGLVSPTVHLLQFSITVHLLQFSNGSGEKILFRLMHLPISSFIYRVIK